MRTTKSLRVGCAVAVFALALGAFGVARADVSTERPGSILIFPKVVNTTDQDTIIQISSANSALAVHARCFYVDGSADPNNFGAPRCQVSDFNVWLTRQQPSHWQVSQGRRMDPSDNMLGNSNYPQGAGYDPGAVPPVPTGFTGELVCVEVSADDTPVAMNSLKGEATIRAVRSGDVSKYNAIAFKGNSPNSDSSLLLDNVEYNACPASIRYDLIREGAPDPVVQRLGNGGLCSASGLPCNLYNGNADCPGVETCETGAGVCSVSGTACSVPGDCPGVQACDLTGLGRSKVRNFLTLVPCAHDFETLQLQTAALSIQVRDEFETPLSADLNVTCWAMVPMSDSRIATAFANRATPFLYATLRPSNPDVGMLAIPSSVVTDTALNSASTAGNVHIPIPLDPNTQVADPAIIQLSIP